MPPRRAATTDLIWDFSEFTEQMSITSETGVPNVGYNGLIIQGAMTSDKKDYISTEGVHFNGATKTAQRAIVYTPSLQGRLTVAYKSNGSTARGCYISTHYGTTDVIAMDSDVVGSVTARLSPGQQYIIGCDAGITITNVIFSPF